MNGYLVSVALTVISSGIVGMLSPEHAKTKKYLTYLCGVCIICSMLLPVQKMLGVIPSLIESISVSSADIENDVPSSVGDVLTEILNDEISETVKKDIKNRFGIEVAYAGCNIEYLEEEKEAVLKEVEIRCGNLSEYEKSDIKKYLSDIYECEINIEENERE